MNTLQVAFAAGVLVLAGTAAQSAPGAGRGVANGSASAQSQGERALAAREGYTSQPNSDLGLPEYGRRPHELLSFQVEKLRAFRAEALRRQQEDGGKLSDSDRAYLHAELDRILVP